MLDQLVQERLERFVSTLLHWNASINLIARGDAEQVWTRHIADCLQLGTLMGRLPERLTDLGSGGGFPGLVLSIAYGVKVDLIEEDRRKCAFLREAARITGAPATVHQTRIERAAVPPAPVVTARALASVSRLLAYAVPLLQPNGICWFPKGQGADLEVAEARRHWNMDVESFASATDAQGVILRISNISGSDLRPPG